MTNSNVPPMTVDDFERMQYPRGEHPALNEAPAELGPNKPRRGRRGRRSLASDEQPSPVSETVDTTAAEEQPAAPKRGQRRKNQPAQEPLLPTGMVSLTPEQLSKLWQTITGGHIEINGDSIAVSLDSFKRALPVLLDRL